MIILNPCDSHVPHSLAFQQTTTIDRALTGDSQRGACWRGDSIAATEKRFPGDSLRAMVCTPDPNDLHGKARSRDLVENGYAAGDLIIDTLTAGL